MFFGGNFYDSSYPFFIIVGRKVLLEIILGSSVDEHNFLRPWKYFYINQI